jgi:hypothetical protein
VLPVKYEFNFHILLRRNSVFEWLAYVIVKQWRSHLWTLLLVLEFVYSEGLDYFLLCSRSYGIDRHAGI